MSYIGSTPANKLVTSSDMEDGIVTTAKIANDAATADKIANAVNSAITANTSKTTNATHSGEVTGSGALTIAGNVVDEANLKVSNSPTNGYSLVARSGNTGGMTWEAPSGGDYVRLAGTDNTAGSQININGHFSADYKYYRLYGRMMGNSNSYPELRIMQGGSTISGDLYKYSAGGSQSNSGGSSNTQHYEGRGTNHVRLSVWNNQDINQTKDFTITISNPIKVVNERPSIQWECWGLSVSAEWQHVQGFAIYDNNVNWTGISLITSDGDTGCKWITDLYGLKHS